MKDLTTKAADNIRILAASMVEKAKSGHPGGAMGGADFVNVLYSEFLKYNPDDPHYPFRDRFFLDPGHMSPMLYSVLSLAGYFKMDELAAFLDGKPEGLEVVLTGHSLPGELARRADYISHVTKEKHPYDEGVMARPDIEF